MEIKRYLPKVIYYRVKEGDDKRCIANKFNTSISNVLADEVSCGDVVKVLNACEKVHIVKPLETLKQIATQYKVDEDRLMNINNLSSKVLFVGQRLKIND